MRLAAALGAAVALLPAVLFVAWACLVNPWFNDVPVLLGLLVFLPLALGGGAAGARLGRRRRVGQLGRGLLGVLLGVELMCLGFATFPRSPPAAEGVRLLVVGIDGASWDQLDPLAAEGRLPALSALQERGHRAVLRAEEPLFSPLLWTTMATGQRPEVHGIRGFRTRADQARVPRFWDIAVDQGRSVGLYKWLVTWPPFQPPAGGFVVPAWLAPTPETAPPELSFVKEIELSRRLKRKRVRAVRPGWRLALAGIPEGLRASTLLLAAEWTLRERLTRPGEAERAWRLQLLRVQLDRDVFLAQLAREAPELATFTTYAPDALGHTHWDALETCRAGGDCPPWGRAVEEALLQADAVLAELLAAVGPEATVLVLSDHGLRAMEAGDAGRYFAPRTERLRTRLEAVVGPVDVARVGHKVAVTLLAEDPLAQLQAVDAELQTWTQASTGEPLYRTEPIEGSEVALGLTFRDERIDAERLSADTVGGEPLSDYARLTEAYSGEHHADGIWLAAGPGVVAASDAEVEAGEPVYLQVDVAPTILALLGIPAGADMPGEVRHGELLPRVPTWAHLAPESRGEVTDEDVNTELLEQLGYIER